MKTTTINTNQSVEVDKKEEETKPVKFLNVLLISLQENLCTFGIRYIFYAVRKAGHNPTLFYPNLNYEFAKTDCNEVFYKEFERFLKVNRIDIVGVSFMSYQNTLVKRISGFLKNNYANVPFIGGGIHATAFPEDSLQYLDAVCVGEGEVSFVNFLNQYSRKGKLSSVNTPGILTCFTGQENYRKNLPFLNDLDLIDEFPVLDEPTFFYQRGTILILSKDKSRLFHRYNGNGYDITTSRGCPMDCTYCADNIFKNLYGNQWKRVRTRSAEHVITELKHAIREKPTIQFINFHDDSFSSRPIEWLQQFANWYNKEIKLPLMFRAIPGSIDERKMQCFSQLNVMAIGIGLQSGSYRVLSQVYNRPIKISAFIDTIVKLHAKKIIPIIDVMLNNPYETREDIYQTIKTLSALPKPFILELYGFRFYPGTEITERALRDGIIQRCDTTETQASIESNTGKDFLNKIIFITPHFSRKFISWLVRNEKNALVKGALPLFILWGSFLNLFYFMYMIFRSQRYNPFRFVVFLYNTQDAKTSVFHVFPFLRNILN